MLTVAMKAGTTNQEIYSIYKDAKAISNYSFPYSECVLGHVPPFYRFDAYSEFRPYIQDKSLRSEDECSQWI